MLYSPLLGNPRFEDIALGALSGVALAIALTTLWRAYALSSIGVAAPIAAVVSTVVPVLYGAARVEDAWRARMARDRGRHRGAVPDIVATRRRSIAGGRDAWTCFGSVLLSDVHHRHLDLRRIRHVADRAAAVDRVRARPRGGVGDAATTVRGWVGDARQRARGCVRCQRCGGSRVRRPARPDRAGRRRRSMYPAVAIALAWVFMDQVLTPRQILGVVGGSSAWP